MIRIKIGAANCPHGAARDRIDQVATGHVGDRLGEDDLAASHHRDAIRDLEHLTEPMGDIDDR